MATKKRVLAGALVFVMLGTSVFAGGGSEDEGSTGDMDNLNLTGLPIVKETESFSFLIDDSIDPSRIDDLEMIKLVEENTNVDVDWDVYPHDIAKERMNLLINTGDYPDAIGGWLVGGADIVKYGTGEGIFIPLEDLFAEYAPNVMEALAVPGVRADMTLPDGHIYSPPYPTPDQPEMSFAPWINQVWLDNLGLEMPTTIDEFYDVLVAFKEEDANGNGDPNDEIPIGAQPARLAFWLGLFGLGPRSAGADIVLVDGEVIFTPTDESYKDGIKFLKKLYAEQLLDTEIFTADHDSFFANGKGKDAIYGAAILYSPTDISPGLGEDGLNIRSDDYVPLPPLDNGTGKETLWGRGSLGTYTFATQMVVTDASENLGTIIRWIDYVYDAEISLQMQHGKFGVTLQKNADGSYEYMEKTDITGAPGYAQWLWAIPRFVRQADTDKVIKNALALQGQGYLDSMDAVWADNMTDMLPRIWSTEAEAKEISTITVDLDNHIALKRADWITGAADIDAEWDQYIEDLNSMGLERYMEIKTSQITAALGN